MARTKSGTGRDHALVCHRVLALHRLGVVHGIEKDAVEALVQDVRNQRFEQQRFPHRMPQVDVAGVRPVRIGRLQCAGTLQRREVMPRHLHLAHADIAEQTRRRAAQRRKRALMFGLEHQQVEAPGDRRDRPRAIVHTPGQLWRWHWHWRWRRRRNRDLRPPRQERQRQADCDQFASAETATYHTRLLGPPTTDGLLPMNSR